MFSRILIRLSTILFMLVGLPAYAVTNNTQPLKLTPGGTAITGPTLVKNAKVSVVASDFWGADIVAVQLITTDATSNEPAWNSSNWSTIQWPDNECSANAPHSGAISFAVNAATTSSNNTDNKLQKLLSMVQVAQLTGMQITIVGVSVTGDPGEDCVVGNIQDIFLRNTTY